MGMIRAANTSVLAFESTITSAKRTQDLVTEVSVMIGRTEFSAETMSRLRTKAEDIVEIAGTWTRSLVGFIVNTMDENVTKEACEPLLQVAKEFMSMDSLGQAGWVEDVLSCLRKVICLYLATDRVSND